jgi:hypothetical protein
MNELDGATQTPPPNMASGTPGEFAARWNERTDAERQAYLDGVYEARLRADQCWVQQHERIDEYRAAFGRLEVLLARHAAEQREPYPVQVPLAQIRAAIEPQVDVA